MQSIQRGHSHEENHFIHLFIKGYCRVRAKICSCAQALSPPLMARKWKSVLFWRRPCGSTGSPWPTADLDLGWCDLAARPPQWSLHSHPSWSYRSRCRSRRRERGLWSRSSRPPLQSPDLPRIMGHCYTKHAPVGRSAQQEEFNVKYFLWDFRFLGLLRHDTGIWRFRI
jgi:hypothetical protein